VSEIKIIFNIDEANDRSGGDEDDDLNVSPSKTMPVIIFKNGKRVLGARALRFHPLLVQ
jgi:hypothetical protein